MHIDPSTELAQKVAVNVITEAFKAAMGTFRDAVDWFKSQNEEHDFFGTAARKYAERMEGRYDTMRIFGMNEPVPLRTIYTRVNVLGQITARHQAPIQDLQSFLNRDTRKLRPEDHTTREGIEVIDEIRKVIVLGKPGAGKTTFLKYILLQALDGNLKNQKVPIFVSLKDWSDSQLSLFDFIVKQFDICNLPESDPLIDEMLIKGKCLLLLDGFDEVSRSVDAAIQEIRDLNEKYPKNRIVLSCRIAAYSYCFEKFTEVEIADFTDREIVSFVNNWFGKGSPKATACLTDLNQNDPIKELATIPLLLTMLCLAFDETMTFPANRAELYKEALDALLKKWDSSRSVKREEIYRHLSLRRKESMFSHIAASTFEKDQYYIPQKMLEKKIAEYIRNLPEVEHETLEVDSEAILKAIEAQHGIFVERAKKIYSFSHLTFHEYFTAHYLAQNERSLESLVRNYLLKDKWREVFLLTASMLDNADPLFRLMQQRIQEYGLQKIGSFLMEIQKHAADQQSPFELGARIALAFYHILSIAPDTYAQQIALDLAFALDPRVEVCLADNNLSAQILDKAHYRQILLGSMRQQSVSYLAAVQIYLKANKLLMDCLKTECYVSPEQRKEIFDTALILPT
jgi:hypothetical protein